MNYAKHYDLLIVKHGSQTKPKGYSERHHIVPKCLGGSDEESNLIYLSAEAHYVAHQLLVKMHPSHHGLSYAAMLMTRVSKGNGRASNKYYSWLKRRYSKVQSIIIKEWLKENGNPSTREDVKVKRREAWLGDKNPSYGKPNWKAIEAAALAKRGTSQTETHNAKISEAIKKWHAENKDKHPMKNPETLAKAIASRKATAERKKLEKEKHNG